MGRALKGWEREIIKALLTNDRMKAEHHWSKATEQQSEDTKTPEVYYNTSLNMVLIDIQLITH